MAEKTMPLAGYRIPAPPWKYKAPNLHKINGFGKYNRGKIRLMEIAGSG